MIPLLKGFKEGDIMIKYKNILDNELAIFDNIFINNGVVTAYYVLFPYNYNVMDLTSAKRHIQRLYTTINTLYSTVGEIKMSMFKLKSIVSKEETINQITRTIKMYKKDYEGFPDKYKKLIKNISKDLSILAIDIDIKDTINIETQGIIEILKNSLDYFIKKNFSMTAATIDEEAILSQNIRIKNSLQRYAVPATSELVMNIYVNSVFPSYNLVYNDFLVKNNSPILSGIKQEFIPHLGWFEMSNSGIVAFGAEPRVTYGCVLTILEFPESIYSQNFNIGVPNLNVNMHLLPKEKAVLKFKRMRANILEEAQEEHLANTIDSHVETEVSLIQRAIQSIRDGRIVSNIDANILVLADSVKELDAKKRHIISVLSDIDVICSIAGNQARTYVNSFVKKRPIDYYHVMDLQYALSFQLDSGVSVGDGDSKFGSMVIGVG